MTIQIIITICLLLLLAYLFDLSSQLTKIPSVILLLLLGWAAKQGADFFNVEVPVLNPLLPALGTLGLILIVLDGALELELNKSKIPLVVKSSLVAIVPMLVFALVLTFAFHYFAKTSYKIALINTIPFCVISSAIAIPSVKNLSAINKEFIIYESSLSDIFGILFFNFIALNTAINGDTFAHFGMELLVIILIS